MDPLEPPGSLPVALPARTSGRRLLLLGGLWLFIVGVVAVFRSVLLPFAGAAIIAYLVAPAVDWLSQRRVGKRQLPRWGALLVVYGVFFLLSYAFLIALLPQLYREVARISRDLLTSAESLNPERSHELADRLEIWLGDHGLPVELTRRTLDSSEPGAAFGLSLDLEKLLQDLSHRASGFLESNLGNILHTSRMFVGGVLASIFMLFFMLMVAAFFSIDARRIGRYLATLIPPELESDARTLLERINSSLSGVVRGQVTICGVNGALTLVGLLLFRVKFAFLLASLATLLSLVPIFGTIISSVPIFLVAVTGSWKAGVAMLVWIAGIHALEAYFLNPKIMGQAARIHPVVVAFSLLAGERTYGIVGALLAAPLAAILVACFEFVRQKAQPRPG